MIAPLPKTVNSKSRADEQRARRTQEATDQRLCYAVVDARDEGQCRVCGRRVSIRAITMQHKAIHHHLIFRSRGGMHEPWNVVTICCDCNAEIHVEGTLRLEGNADLRDPIGRLCGIQVSRLRGEVWAIEKMA